jgi:hypothetical protein
VGVVTVSGSGDSERPNIQIFSITCAVSWITHCLSIDRIQEKSRTHRREILVKLFQKIGMDKPREYAKRFIAEEIDEKSLSDLSEEHIEQLLPTIGARNRLKKYLQLISSPEV